MRNIMVRLVGLLLFCVLLCSAEHATALMGRRLRPVPQLSKVPLTQALQWIGGSLDDDFICFGVELDPAEPMVNIDFPEGGTVARDLGLLFQQLPKYEYAAVSEHLISVHPRGAIANPSDVLNTVVKDFNVAGVRAGEIMAWPEIYISELQSPASKPRVVIAVGPMGVGPPVTLHLQGLTVREVLNAVSPSATPV